MDLEPVAIALCYDKNHYVIANAKEEFYSKTDEERLDLIYRNLLQYAEILWMNRFFIYKNNLHDYSVVTLNKKGAMLQITHHELLRVYDFLFEKHSLYDPSPKSIYFIYCQNIKSSKEEWELERTRNLFRNINDRLSEFTDFSILCTILKLKLNFGRLISSYLNSQNKNREERLIILTNGLQRYADSLVLEKIIKE